MSCKASHVDGYVRGHLSAAFESLQEIEAFRHVFKAFSHRSQREGSECVVFFRCPALRIRSQYVVFNVEDAVHVF